MKKPIKALLLAAGKGTRLRPITLKKPKCLVEINGIPILDRWLKKLNQLKVNAILINTHYLYSQVEDFLAISKYKSKSIRIFHEEILLGTAGTLIANKYFFKGSTGLLIHADNYTNINLDELLKAHQRRPSNCLLTMLTFNTKYPKSCGVVETDKDGILIGFHEKKSDPPGNKANGAIYVFDYEFLDLLESKYPEAKDFSLDIIPNFIGNIYTWHTNSPFLDIGTKELLEEAEFIDKEFINAIKSEK